MDIPEGFAAVVTDQEILACQGAGLKKARHFNIVGGDSFASIFCTTPICANHLVLVVGGACSQVGQVSWRRGGSC